MSLSPRKKSARTSERVFSNDRWVGFGVCVFLAVITWLVFGQTLHHDFINYDDNDYVTKNVQVSRGLSWEGIVWAFTHVHSANWHPLTWISHMVDCQFYGLNPRGHHLTSVWLHAFTAILLFLLLRQMTAALWRSAFVAALFAVHPLHVESVAWVAERKDLLSGLFFMLTAMAYTHYTRAPTVRRYALVVIVFALGLMCKPMLVSLPLVLLLLDYWPLQRLPAFISRRADDRNILGRLVLEKLPLIGLGLASCAVTVVAQRAAMQPVTRMSFPDRLANASLAYVDYVRQMFWPKNLAILYPWEEARLTVLNIGFSLALLAGISVGVFLLRRHRYLVTGWLWYLVMLVPVIGILQVGNQARADRYTYLPQIGLYLLITWGAARFCAGWRHRRVPLAALGCAVVGAFVVLGRAQAAYWRDSEILWRHALACTTDNIIAEGNLGEACHVNGKNDEAMMHFENSLRINPRQAAIHSSLGTLLLEIGRVDESLAHLREAVEIEPNFGDAQYNLGNTYLQMGEAREAVTHYQKALEIDPNDIQAMNNLAWILATCSDSGIRDGAKAVELAARADSLTARKNSVISATLAAAQAEAGRLTEALATAQRALQLASREGNSARADSIRIQIATYESGVAFRDPRYLPRNH